MLASHDMERGQNLPDTQRQDRVLERPPPWVRHRKLLLASLACVLALALLTPLLVRLVRTSDSVARSAVTIATVERGTFSRDIVASGQVVAAVSPTLYAPYAGIISLKAHAGDRVVKDQVLAVIDSPDLHSKLSQEEALLESLQTDWKRAQLEADRKLAELRQASAQAQVDRTTAQREFDRSQKAYELGAYSQLQMLRAQDVLEKAKFAEESAQRNLEAQPQQNRFEVDSRSALRQRQRFLVEDLRRKLDALEVRSPVEGRIGQVLVSDRASVVNDAALLTVVDLSALEVEIKVPESLARDLSPGIAAELEGDARKWQATVDAVAPQVVEGEVTARLRLDEQKTDGLRQNQRLSARIYLDKRVNVLMVDRGLFVEQDGGFAYVVEGNLAQRRPVRLGGMSVEKVEILAGLRAGEQIVISGTEAFHGAQRIRLTN